MHSTIARRLIQSSQPFRVGRYFVHGRHSFDRHADVILTSNTLDNEVIEDHRFSPLNKEREVKTSQKDVPELPSNYKEKFPDMLPRTNRLHRDRVAELLERKDMYKRRSQIDTPEFYVGSIMAVSVADQYCPGKSSRFVGICIQRNGHGLRHNFTLRNVIDDQGIEVRYDMYNPLLQKIEVLRLEKRLDDELYYLRDCPLEYSYFPQDMEAQLIHKDAYVPVNTTQIPLNPRPWSERWERRDLKGVQEIVFKNERVRTKLMKLKALPQNTRLWEKEDIMKHYRETINPIESKEILSEVYSKSKKNWK